MPEEMDLEPELVAQRSALLANAAEAQQQAIQALCDEIRDAQSPRPWGNDRSGREFEAGLDLEQVEQVLNHCTAHSQDVFDLAESAGVGALTSQLADEAAHDQMQETAGQVDQLVGEVNALLDGAHGDVAAVWGNPSAADAVVDLNRMSTDPQAREQLGQELLEDVNDLMERVDRPDQ